MFDINQWRRKQSKDGGHNFEQTVDRSRSDRGHGRRPCGGGCGKGYPLPQGGPGYYPRENVDIFDIVSKIWKCPSDRRSVAYSDRARSQAVREWLREGVSASRLGFRGYYPRENFDISDARIYILECRIGIVYGDDNMAVVGFVVEASGGRHMN